MCHHYVRVFDLIAMHVYEVHELLITSSTNGWTEIEGWMDEDDKHSALKITFFPPTLHVFKILLHIFYAFACILCVQCALVHLTYKPS